MIFKTSIYRSRPFVCLSLLLFTTLCCNAQEPKEVTPDIAKKINAEIEMGVQKLRAELQKDKDLTKEWIAFTIDTYRIERYESRYMDYDYSTAGMNDAAHEAADKYDKLLNKYYKMLLARLDVHDKDDLVQAQRAWLAFRDKELALESTLEQDKYSGGGTVQVIRHASFFHNMIKSRAIEMFCYYDSVGNF